MIPRKSKSSQYGFSLIEVLVVSAIFGILALLNAQHFTQMNKNQSSLAEKTEVIALKDSLIQIMKNPQNCAWQLQLGNPAILSGATFDLTTTKTDVFSPSVIELNNIKEGSLPSSPSLVEVGKSIITGKTSGPARVSSIKFKDILFTGTPLIYKGTFEISFDPDSLTIARKSVTLHQYFAADLTNPAAATLLSCTSSPTSSTGAPILYSKSCTYSGAACSVSPCVPANCQGTDTEKTLGCSGLSHNYGGGCGSLSGVCTRVCEVNLTSLPPKSYSSYFTECPWFDSSNTTTSCTPPDCDAASGEISHSLFCQQNYVASGGPSGTRAGVCKRLCLIGY
jgi:prepilin-type N-terminal cleavage/methylation domain-containing protein